MVFKKVMNSKVDWDDFFLDDLYVEWKKWRRFLFSLEFFRIFRMFVDIQNVIRSKLYIFCDVFKDVIGVVIYVKLYNVYGQLNYGFVMGRFKLVFYYSSMILWLELCVVVFEVEIGGFVVDYFNIFIEVCYFYIDS